MSALNFTLGRIHFLRTILSKILDRTGRIEIGRKSEMEAGDVHLGMGVMFASLRHCGKQPNRKLRLKRTVRTGARAEEQSLNIQLGRPSEPVPRLRSLDKKNMTSLQVRSGINSEEGKPSKENIERLERYEPH